jgi:chromosomal replication initiator protein
VIDGVYTIPLIADLCLDDFEPACAAAGKPLFASAPAGRMNGAVSKGAMSNGAVSHRAVSEVVVRATATAAKEKRACQARFVCGPENRLLAEAVDSLLQRSPSPYNPLVLCGPPGTGKSHVARGIARHWRSIDRDVLYTSGADFARGFAAALENETIAGWRSRNRDTSLFILEDLSQLSGKGPALSELLFTLDAVLQQQGQALLTTCLPPRHIAGIPAALAARLVGGLVLQLSPPGPAARLALIEQFARLCGLDLSPGPARLLAEGLAVTPPELFGAITEISVQCKIDGEPITTDRVRAFLAASRSNGAVRPTIRSIARLSAKYFGLKPGQLTSSTRRRAVVQARNVAIYLARQLSGNSLEQLGAYFGGRDHTTILHGYRTIESRSRTDPTIRQALTELRRLLAHG